MCHNKIENSNAPEADLECRFKEEIMIFLNPAAYREVFVSNREI